MEEITLNMPIFGNNITATATEEETSFSKVKKTKGVFTAHLPGYTSPSLNDDSVSSFKLEVNRKQKALMVDDSDFRLNYELNPLSNDIASTLVEDFRQTAEKRYNAKNVLVRLDLENPTCYIFGKPNKVGTDASAPLQPKPTHHSAETSKQTTTSPHTTKPTLPTNNEIITRKQLEELVNRIVKEREKKIKELYKKKILKQRHSYEVKLREQKKRYKLQLQQQQPRLELPKNDQQLVDWVNNNWKRLEPTFKHYANSLFMGHSELVHGGKDGKGDQLEAKRYKQQAINIMALQFKELFNYTNQKSPNVQTEKNKNKNKGKDNGISK